MNKDHLVRKRSGLPYRLGFNQMIVCRVLLVLSLCCFSGCSDEGEVSFVNVSGSITFCGEPLANAKVMFVPTVAKSGNGLTNPISFGVTDENGQYSLSMPGGASGAVVGSHTVLVSKIGTAGSSSNNDQASDDQKNVKSEIDRDDEPEEGWPNSIESAVSGDGEDAQAGNASEEIAPSDKGADEVDSGERSDEGSGETSSAGHRKKSNLKSQLKHKIKKFSRLELLELRDAFLLASPFKQLPSRLMGEQVPATFNTETELKFEVKRNGPNQADFEVGIDR